LGIQHPPAYPLHSLIGRLFNFIPVGAPAFRINMMAAFFGALTCALLVLALQVWFANGDEAGLDRGAVTMAATVAGLVLGLSKTFWSQSLAAKGGIYTLHSACIAGLLLCMGLWSEEAAAVTGSFPQRPLSLLGSRWFRLAVFIFALSFGNHWETQALLVPATLVFVFLVLKGDGPWLFWRTSPISPAGKNGARKPNHPKLAEGAPAVPVGLWAWPLGLAAVGLSVYAYLPLRASFSPFLDWGDPRDWNQFWWVFQRQEYLDLEVGFLKSLRAFLLGAGPWSAVVENWAFVQRQGLRVLAHLLGPEADLGWPAVLLALGGTWVLGQASLGQRMFGWARSRAQALAAWMLVLLAAFVFVITFYFYLKPEMVWILDVFLIPAYVVQASLAGLGLLVLWRSRVLRPVAESRGGQAFLLVLPWAFAAVLFIARADSLSQARQFIAWDYGQDLLLSAKRNAIVLAEGDFNTMPVYYLQQVAHLRPDVDHVTTVFLSTDWGTDHARVVQPRLGLGALPKTITGARAGDGQVLRAAMGQIAVKAQAEGRPIQSSWFREVLAANVSEWEPGFRPSGLLTELNGPVTPEEDRRRLGLMKALRTRHLEFDRRSLDPSPEFALSNYGTAYLELANYLRGRGLVAQALPLYTEAAVVSSRSNLAEILTHHGIALAAMPTPDLAGAADLFRQAVQVKPIYEAYANLSGVCNQLGQASKQVSYFLEAETAARQALALAPSSPQAWNNLAIALYYQNRRDDAIGILRQASQLAPTDPQIAGNLRALSGGH
jgi:tetratricopeptide (TPR) repeat protein